MLYSPAGSIPYNENLSVYNPHELCQLTKNTSEELLSYFNEHSKAVKNAMPLALRTTSAQSLDHFFIHLESDTKKPRNDLPGPDVLVGDRGFEPLTLWSQTRCATGLR